MFLFAPEMRPVTTRTWATAIALPGNEASTGDRVIQIDSEPCVITRMHATLEHDAAGILADSTIADLLISVGVDGRSYYTKQVQNSNRFADSRQFAPLSAIVDPERYWRLVLDTDQVLDIAFRWATPANPAVFDDLTIHFAVSGCYLRELPAELQAQIRGTR